jgi:hypothetical protein
MEHLHPFAQFIIEKNIFMCPRETYVVTPNAHGYAVRMLEGQTISLQASRIGVVVAFLILGAPVDPNMPPATLENYQDFINCGVVSTDVPELSVSFSLFDGIHNLRWVVLGPSDLQAVHHPIQAGDADVIRVAYS